MEHEVFSSNKKVIITTDGIFASSLRYIERRLEPFAKNGKVTTEITNTKTGHQLAITITSLPRKRQQCELTAHKITSTLVDAIANVVITDCKYHYIESSLKLPVRDEISRQAFIRALANFDRTQDLCIAKSLIKLTPNFLLDSFYTFSLDVLKTRWQEVCALANDNACYLVCDGTFRELLRFLISNLETRHQEVHLFDRAGKVEVLASNLKPIPNIYINDELSQDSAIISTLISIAPKKIYIHQTDYSNCELSTQQTNACHSERSEESQVLSDLSRTKNDNSSRLCEEHCDEAIPTTRTQTPVFTLITELFRDCVQIIQTT